ncbi:TonB-dependent receptor plug domain-containing protein [Nitratiruptor tergarcus]|uniref:Iron complex outermembrane recepter protein n=1 Tax=Nitratiruptor tergarcus DSM 16512 TaxID=1069081 RepID=A0A1W1WQM7_9BACT|nr:TonB-dependent receptor plug domain-containing protein [Nitratiruptor tergarcus]SMC08546.1 iron complex outermembrane recepter protein [Nitratiruptor tergarcus DSM 16512]
MRGVAFLSFFLAYLYGANIDLLLQKYKEASELSKITKRDSAGFVYVFTREDLQKMQSYTLKDILQTVPGINYTLTPNNLNLFSAVSTKFSPINIARLYINDHDVTSASFGSALLIWGQMPLEYVDHIEVYKGSSSIEFGDETGLIIIKVYTKLAQRELGKKIRLIADSRGSKGFDSYIAELFDNKSSLFGYIHGTSFKTKHYHNGNYLLSRDGDDKMVYLNFKKNDLQVEFSHYEPHRDPFLGYGRSKKPLGGGLDARHTYLKLDKNIYGISWSFAFDRLDYKRLYKDANGVYTSQGIVDIYYRRFTDDILSLNFKKHIDEGKHSLLLGGFYKIKKYKERGTYDTIHTYATNRLGLATLYLEESYSIDKETLFILSAKNDWYEYQKEIPSHTNMMVRAGFIKKSKEWEFKTFYTKTMLEPQFFSLYSDNNIPLVTNPHLKPSCINLFIIGALYKKENFSFGLKYGTRNAKNMTSYSPQKGYYNIPNKIYFDFIEAKAQYQFDPKNRVTLYIIKGRNSQKKFSPDIHINLQAFNSFDNIDIYNELLYKNSYTYFGTSVTDSLDYTVAIKYRINNDLSIGLRGENLFGKGFKQAYRKINTAYPTTDRKILLNMEYTF